jgi:hypothetical protein
MNKKDKIKYWFETHPDTWISTRDLRNEWGEASDRRIRELKAEGFHIVSRRREVDGKKFFTFYWSHPSKQGTLFN